MILLKYLTGFIEDHLAFLYCIGLGIYLVARTENGSRIDNPLMMLLLMILPMTVMFLEMRISRLNRRIEELENSRSNPI